MTFCSNSCLMNVQSYVGMLRSREKKAFQRLKYLFTIKRHTPFKQWHLNLISFCSFFLPCPASRLLLQSASVQLEFFHIVFLSSHETIFKVTLAPFSFLLSFTSCVCSSLPLCLFSPPWMCHSCCNVIIMNRYSAWSISDTYRQWQSYALINWI